MARIKSADSKEITRDEERTMLGKQLLIACSRNELEKVKALIEKGADPNYRNIHNETPVLAACEGAAMDVLQFLVTKGASLDVKTASDQHPIHFAAASGNEALVRWLAQRGQNLTAQAYDGSTPLHVATRQGQADVARWLLSNKAVNVNKADYSGLTPAHIAAVMPRRRPVLEILIASGANLNKESFRGDSVLHLAARKAEQEILVFLIEKGAKIGCPQCNKDGKNCEILDERAAAFLRQETAKWKVRQKGIKKESSKEVKEKKDKKDKKAEKDDPKKDAPPPVGAVPNGERKSFDGLRPDMPAAAPPAKDKKGFFGNFLRRDKERSSSPGKLAISDKTAASVGTRAGSERGSDSTPAPEVGALSTEKLTGSSI